MPYCGAHDPNLQSCCTACLFFRLFNTLKFIRSPPPSPPPVFLGRFLAILAIFGAPRRPISVKLGMPTQPMLVDTGAPKRSILVKLGAARGPISVNFVSTRVQRNPQADGHNPRGCVVGRFPARCPFAFFIFALQVFLAADPSQPPDPSVGMWVPLGIGLA